MKNLIIIALLASLASCQYINGKNEIADSTSTVDNNQYDSMFIVSRDTSINPTNAYNDLFVDSAAVETYIARNSLNSKEAQAIKGFYNLRNYQFAWFAKDGLMEQGRSFWNAYTYAETHGQKDSIRDKTLMARMDTIVDIDTVMITANDSLYLQTEVALTHRFIHYFRNSDGQNLIHQLPLTHLLPIHKVDPLVMADSVLSFKPRSPTNDSINTPYTALKQQLEKYDSVAEKGGWSPIVGTVGVLRKGISSPAVTAIKRRLRATGDFTEKDTTAKFTDSLELAIRSYQERNGLNPDGFITDSLVSVMNVPVEERIKQILVNMNRMAWIPPEVKDNFVAVNIPEFMLEAHEGDSVPVKMEVVVGKEGTNTMMFTGDLNQVVFSPSWNLPASIVENEVLPAMQNDKNYLKSRHMEIVGKNGNIPEIKQLPGPGNALGKVKFLFPNSYDIYLHDTEAKALFDQNKRAFSHGCIRLEDAEKMAEYVLRNNSNWTPDKIKTAMNSNKEQPVAVGNPIPVVITYFTTWVDDKGRLNFREDIYSHDKRTGGMMFTNKV